MAKASKGNGATVEENGASAPGNGGLVFEVMPDGYQIPERTRGGQWDAVIAQLCEKANKGKTIRLFKTTKDQVQQTYTRAKALKNAAKRLNKALTVAVRIEDDQSVLLAQAT